MTNRIKSMPSYAQTVGIIEVLNEPQTSYNDGGMPQQEKDTLTQKYYPQALAAVRAAEGNIPDSQRLHVQFMDQLWGSGNPKSNLPSDSNIIFDDHNYVGNAVQAIHPGQTLKQADYMWYTCKVDNRLTDGDTPKIVQEFSLITNDQDSSEFTWHDAQGNPSATNAPFFKQWFNAQQRLYEQTNGWIFWNWKTKNNDPRWDYSYLVSIGWVPPNQAGLDASGGFDVCKSYFPNN
jgi:aryl-phospho-beta-D-glucosidase BglC (GH1 family)